MKMMLGGLDTVDLTNFIHSAIDSVNPNKKLLAKEAGFTSQIHSPSCPLPTRKRLELYLATMQSRNMAITVLLGLLLWLPLLALVAACRQAWSVVALCALLQVRAFMREMLGLSLTDMQTIALAIADCKGDLASAWQCLAFCSRWIDAQGGYTFVLAQLTTLRASQTPLPIRIGVYDPNEDARNGEPRLVRVHTDVAKLCPWPNCPIAPIKPYEPEPEAEDVKAQRLAFEAQLRVWEEEDRERKRQDEELIRIGRAKWEKEQQLPEQERQLWHERWWAREDSGFEDDFQDEDALEALVFGKRCSSPSSISIHSLLSGSEEA